MEDKLLMLFKFGEKSNLEKLQKGNLYFKSAEYYNEYEKQSGNTSIGDRYDSQEVIYNAEYRLINSTTNKKVYSGIAPVIAIKNTQLLKCALFCCSYISVKDLSKVSECENSTIFECDCSKFFKDFFNKEYWDHCLIIPSHNLITQLNETCSNKSIHWKRNKVKYYDPEKPPIERENDIIKDFRNMTYWKVNNYNNQREYRFILTNKFIDNKDDSYILDIGDMTQYTQIIKTNELENLILQFEFKKNNSHI